MTAGLEMCAHLADEIGRVELVALFRAVERDFRLVIADFAHEA